MNVNTLFYCISNALSDESVILIELVGIKHTFTLNPKKVIDLATRQEWLWITKQIGDRGVDQLLINPNQIIYARIRKEGKNG